MRWKGKERGTSESVLLAEAQDPHNPLALHARIYAASMNSSWERQSREKGSRDWRRCGGGFTPSRSGP